MRLTGPSTATKQKLWDRADGCCERCGKFIRGYEFSRHHRRPRGMGGSRRADTNSLCNLMILCGSATTPGGCHAWVESSRDLAEAYGFLLRQSQSPAAEPVRVAVYGWVLLDDRGNYVPSQAPVDPEVAA